MQLGVIGLGRMGANITRRLMADGHRAVVYDIDAAAVARLDGEGATGAACYAELVAKLDRPRSIWVMVPAGLVDRVLAELTPLLHADDVVIDGGNSYYRDDVARAAALAPLGVHYVDVGTSGGVFGLERGFCLMIGGEPVVVERSTRSSRRSLPAPEPRRARPAGPDRRPRRRTATCIAARSAPGTS